MDATELSTFKLWFTEYTDGYLSKSASSIDRENLSFKVSHTLDVCKNIVDLAKGESLTDSDIILAEVVALFHDVGRFPQYAEWRAYRDGISVNHGELGHGVIKEAGILDGLQPEERDVVLQAVKYHNAYALPRISDKALLMLKLVRDADKLDIWRVFIENFEKLTANDEISEIFFGLKKTPGYSEDMFKEVFAGGHTARSKARNLNDFTLILLSWVYDLNFKTSYRLLTERGFIDKVADKLPVTDDINKLVSLLKDFAAHAAS